MLHAVSLAIVLQLSNLAGAPASVIAAAQTEVAGLYFEVSVTVRRTCATHLKFCTTP